LSRALATAYFVDARDISDTDTLADMAGAHGMDREETKRLLESDAELGITRRDAAASAALGVRSVPHYIFNDNVQIAGGQQEAAFVEAIRRAL
jgi:predicted DsbA family dithiol-disulfide isomerase